MTASPSVFVDTNVLIYAKLTASPFHAQAVGAIRGLEQSGASLWISRQVLREYLAALTRPQTLVVPIAPEVLAADVRTFARQLRLAEDGPPVTERLLDLITTRSVAGKQIHDANIVATMLTYGIDRLLTHNVDDFRRFSALITVVPLEGGTIPAAPQNN